jgi:hypothetical protein
MGLYYPAIDTIHNTTKYMKQFEISMTKDVIGLALQAL